MNREEVEVRIFLDEWEVVVTKEKEGGDSLGRTSELINMYSYLEDNGMHEKTIKRFELMEKLKNCCYKGQGKWCRHGDKSRWYSRTGISRDQATPLVIALINTGERELLKEYFKDHLKRFLLFTDNYFHNWQYEKKEEHERNRKRFNLPPWNGNKLKPVGDPTGPEFWALYIRGMKRPWLYPLLYILDMHTLLRVLFQRFFTDSEDVIVGLNIVMFGLTKRPTLVMKLANLVMDHDDMFKRMSRYFGQEAYSDFHLAYYPVLKHMKANKYSF